eukprot:COSAG06_NODE_66590_length_254_cov_0.625806_1_plen_81_part_10
MCYFNGAQNYTAEVNMAYYDDGQGDGQSSYENMDTVRNPLDFDEVQNYGQRPTAWGDGFRGADPSTCEAKIAFGMPCAWRF